MEDPVSVSRKFSQKFHDFFSSIILKGNALGKVTHHFYKRNIKPEELPIIIYYSGLKKLQYLGKVLLKKLFYGFRKQ